MPRKPQPEGLDKVAKIKIAASVGALLIAGLVLASYFTGFSLFGDGRPADPPPTPEQIEEATKQREEIKRQIQEAPAGGGKRPVIVGS